MSDLYAVLEVDRSASPDELKKAYRRLARQYHPDANPGDAAAEARFKEISQAYEILSDPERRANYDRFGTDGPGANPFGSGSVQDIFDMFFGGGGGFGGFGGFGSAPTGPQPGPDAEMSLRITLDEAAAGATREISLNILTRCDDCRGSGAAAGSSPVTCSDCNGAGQVRRVRNSILGQMVTMSPCGRCGGMGTTIEQKCPTCRGEGRHEQPVTFNIQIPAGVEDGSTMRLTDKGPSGRRGGPNGRLFVHLQVESDERFERHGDDLHHEAHITFAQATLGSHITVPTLSGTADVEIEPGTQNGTVHRLRGEGVTHLHGRGRGDLYVHVVVDVPTSLDAESERLLREFAAARGEELPEPAHGLFGRRKGRS